MKHVVDGNRPDMAQACLTPLSSLMQCCWSQDPMARPSAAKVVNELITLQEQLAADPKKTGRSRGRVTLPLPRTTSISRATDAPSQSALTSQSIRTNKLLHVLQGGSAAAVVAGEVAVEIGEVDDDEYDDDEGLCDTFGDDSS